VIYDPAQAGITAHVRGFHFKDALAARGWRMEFLAYSPPPFDSPRRGWREIAIALRARAFGVVYLLKVSSLTLVQRLQEVGGARVVFDLTDSLWREEIGGGIWGDLDRILAESDAVFTCNTFDSEYGARFNPRVISLPSYANVTRFDEARTSAPIRSGDGVRIGWIGSPSTVAGIRNVAEPLERVAARNPGLELRVVGAAEEADLPVFRHLRVSRGPASYDEAMMIREILGMDLGLFPIVIDLEDYRVRGPLKALNYMAGAVPCVCQRAGECERIIQDGVNGLLASTDAEWEARIESLVRDAALRVRIGRAGYETVRKSFSFEAAADLLARALADVLERPAAVPHGPPLLNLARQSARVGARTLFYLVAPGAARRRTQRLSPRRITP
jgi:glycosyltransferase involved in cell wall biosynthesis